jgi:hypothetical protein
MRYILKKLRNAWESYFYFETNINWNHPSDGDRMKIQSLVDRIFSEDIQ